MNNNNYNFLVRSTIFVILFLFIKIGFCSAATIISPLLDFEANPGEIQNGVVKIFNETNQDIYLKSSIEVFSASGELGQPVYLPGSEKNKFLDWFELSQDSILLKSNQVVIVPFSISIPESALPGGYYAVIFWETVSDRDNDNVPLKISSRVGTLIFLKVKGDVKEDAELLDFYVMPIRKYFFGFPLNFIVRLSNNGNIHIRPSIEVSFKNKFGLNETFKMNESNNYILPESIRRFELFWGNKDMEVNFFGKFLSGLKQEISKKPFGKHTAILNISYGIENQRNITERIDFWFFPWRLLVSFSILSLILTAFFYINVKVNKLKKWCKKVE